MEQAAEHVIEQFDEQALKPRRPIPPQFVGTTFKPGVSGNPLGRALPKIRAAEEAAREEAEIDVAIEELVLEFSDTHNRAPKRSECAVLAGLARAERRLRCPTLSAVEMNSTINNIRLARFDLGLRTTKPKKKGIRTFAEMENEKPVINVTLQQVAPPPKLDPAQLDNLFSQFRERHQREPSAGEATQLRTAAELAFKIESGTAKENLGPLAGHLNHTLKSLGLDQRPSSHASRPSAHEYVNQNISDEQTD
jgi:hypothetical protein